MKLTLTQAEEECDRWFAHLQAQDKNVDALKKLAADRRTGKCDAAEGERRRRNITGSGVTVYDGANLREAVKTLLFTIHKIRYEIKG